MEHLLIYEGKVAVILTVFFLFFRILLAREKLHRLNRAVLVSTVAASFLLPLCVITIHKTVPASETMVGALEELSTGTTDLKPGFNWWVFAAIVYFIGILVSLAKIVLDLVNLRKLIIKGEHHQNPEGNTVVVLDEDVSPFSWMHYIFLSRDDYEICSNHIMEHEKAHIRLGHAEELLCVELLSTMQWFNPAMWYLKSDLRSIYEYEADDAVLRNGADIRDYQYSLIRKAVSASGYSITNSFNHSTLKNRITMMTKSGSPAVRGLKVLYILPLLCGTLALNARTIYDAESTDPPAVEQPASEGKAIPFQLVEVKPTFQGGDASQFSKWVNENLVYPEEAKKAGIQGRVLASFTVDNTGKVTDVKIVKGLDPYLDAEALRILNSAPDWTPGEVDGATVKVTYTFPIIFNLK